MPPRKAKTTRRFTESKSPWVTLQREVQQYPELRQKVIQRIEKHLDAGVVSYFTSFHKPDGMINDADAEMMESVLADQHDGGRLVLIINSAGGDALAAERIVNICRAYSNDQFEVLVPHMAKSAATMICFGAHKIHMSDTAELGPVDPQVAYPNDANQPVWISAEEYVRSYNKLMEQASSGEAQRIEPFLQQLQRYDSRYVEKLISAQKLSEDISIRLLKTSMMKAASPADIKKKAEVFLSQSKTSAHGRMINAAEAKACGLSIRRIDLKSDLWNDVWELFVRSDWCMKGQCAKLIESSKATVSC